MARWRGSSRAGAVVHHHLLAGVNGSPESYGPRCHGRPGSKAQAAFIAETATAIISRPAIRPEGSLLTSPLYMAAKALSLARSCGMKIPEQYSGTCRSCRALWSQKCHPGIEHRFRQRSSAIGASAAVAVAASMFLSRSSWLLIRDDQVLIRSASP